MPTILQKKFQLSEHNNLSRWEKIIPDYEEVILTILIIAKQELNNIFQKLLPIFLEKLNMDIRLKLELTGIARLLKISLGECILLQIAYEYMMQGTTIIYKVEEGITFFRNIYCPKLEQIKYTFIILDVYNGETSKYKALTCVGYAGFLAVLKDTEKSILTVEGSGHILNLTFIQTVFRYIKNKWTPGLLLRFLIESEKNKVELVNIMKNNEASIPYRFNYIDYNKDEVLKVVPPNIIKMPERVPLVQTFGDSVNPSGNIKDNSFEALKFLKKERYDEIQKLYSEEFFIYCKILKNAILINGDDLQ